MSVAVGSLDDESPQCLRCEFFLDEYADATLRIVCPDCRRRLPNATDLILRASPNPSVLELLPESVARHNHIIPFAERGRELIVLSDITKHSVRDTTEKLRFILARSVVCLHAEAVAIERAMIRDYGPPNNELYDDPDLFG